MTAPLSLLNGCVAKAARSNRAASASARAPPRPHPASPSGRPPPPAQACPGAQEVRGAPAGVLGEKLGWGRRPRGPRATIPAPQGFPSFSSQPLPEPPPGFSAGSAQHLPPRFLESSCGLHAPSACGPLEGPAEGSLRDSTTPVGPPAASASNLCLLPVGPPALVLLTLLCPTAQHPLTFQDCPPHRHRWPFLPALKF